MQDNKIFISQVQADQVEEIKDFVLRVRKILFPMLDQTIVPRDILNFMETYKSNPLGGFLQARNASGQIVGVIGMMEYNHRFGYLNYPQEKIVEVARLYIEPDYRRIALGSKMVNELKKIALRKGIEVMYLHTHPFLKGAYEFWLKQGYLLDRKCIESTFVTLHMSLNLSNDAD
ncbi:GNAT family N-acetyltransferase [Sphingobacterium shayense]|uniref:GNAT family N-acetyltransferase n=1 Tax=Sphingobacterium shayense TaxID=626343 RepID=UPI001555266F|nr:GNAT family N-acetyltransferase [Sphingobacterium shayense]NQD71746.1 GNAT family N-acetyltransferase [Sphingobacterium shayense]